MVLCRPDGNAPASIAAAVYAGHRYARELDAPSPGEVLFKRERTLV
jgi:dimethylamine/trimethylamine dehydrogenase